MMAARNSKGYRGNGMSTGGKRNKETKQGSSQALFY